jgi:galactarate dehydratase
MKQKIIRIHPHDNVAVVLEDTPSGTKLDQDLVALTDIPQAHKVALQDLPAGASVIRYGVVLGQAAEKIQRGEWVHETSIIAARPPDLEQVRTIKPARPAKLPEPGQTTFSGFRNGDGYAGTRNILGIIPTVQCVAGVLNRAVELIRRDLLPRYPHVDDVVVMNHAYGCGVAIDAPDAAIPIRTIRNLLSHPNFGGETLVVGLGCEKLTPQMLLGPDRASEAVMLQDYAGFQPSLNAILDSATIRLAKLEQRRREILPLKHLLIGLQCGGSDAFSGMTANPAAGYATDLLVASGATVMFSEVTEVRDAVHLLAARASDEQVRDRLIEEMAWYDHYLIAGGVDRRANPSPGNKQGGLSNIIEKALGSVTKSGHAPIAAVIGPGERPEVSGLVFSATPASDLVCGSEQLASGITLQVFLTGRGTPYGLAAAPVLKVSSRTKLQEHWPDLVDYDAGVIATGKKTIAQAGTELFNEILAVAEGRQLTCSEKLRVYNDFCIFNPAPIT